MKKDRNWISVEEKLPYGCGAVHVLTATENEYYGSYRMGKHFLDEGRWLIMDKDPKSCFLIKWAEISDAEREVPEFKKYFK